MNSWSMSHRKIKLWYPGKAQQQMILNYLKDKLAKEEKYSRLNNKKLVGKLALNKPTDLLPPK